VSKIAAVWGRPPKPPLRCRLSLPSSFFPAQVVPSDVGPTIPGVSDSTLRQFLLELARAVASDALEPGKLCTAVRSCGAGSSPGLGEALVDALWYAWQAAEAKADEQGQTRLAEAAKEAMKDQLVSRVASLASTIHSLSLD
jgi:hypothetical protein